MSFPPVRLTRREAELRELLLTTQGGNKEIAHRMCITEGTVKICISRLFGKIGCSSRLELLARENSELRAALAEARAALI